jgi:hypothetical protein
MPFAEICCPACAHVGVVSRTRLPGVLVCVACDGRAYHHGRRNCHGAAAAATAARPVVDAHNEQPKPRRRAYRKKRKLVPRPRKRVLAPRMVETA